MNFKIFGQTASGLGIISYEFSAKTQSNASKKLKHLLILGGVHGDEIEGVWAAHELLHQFTKNYDYKLRTTIVPAFNLDGVLARTRTNSHNVDLNRNLSTQDWSPVITNPRYPPGPHAASEPENQALIAFLQTPPDFILSLHSWKPMLNVNGDCGKFVEVLAQKTGYVIEPSIGYPTPGALGTYAGLERKIPTLTYEIERGLAQDKIMQIHVPAILEAMKTLEV